MNPELEAWRSKALLSGIEKYYNINYQTEVLVSYAKKAQNLPLPPVKVIGYAEIGNYNNEQTFIIPDTVHTILDGGIKFIDTSVTKVKLSKNLRNIPQYTFANLDIQNIIIPKSVVLIQRGAFMNCRHLEKVQFESKDTLFEISSLYDTPWFENLLIKIKNEANIANIQSFKDDTLLIAISKTDCNGINNKMDFKVNRDVWSMKDFESLVLIIKDMKKLM